MPTYTIFARDKGTGASSAWETVDSSSTVSAAAALAGPGTTAIGGTVRIGWSRSTTKATVSRDVIETFLEFDTSSANIVASDTITGVTLNLYHCATGNSGATPTYNQYFYAGFAYGDNVAAGYTLSDYRNPASLSSMTKVASISFTGAFTDGAVAAFSQVGTAFNTAINRSGFTQLVGLPDKVVNNDSAWDSADGGASYTYTSPAASQNYPGGTTAVPAANKPNIVVTTTAGGASAQSVTATGIATAEAFGTAAVTVAAPPAQPQTLTVTGIASAEAFGGDLVSVASAPQTVSLAGQGIPSATAFGTALVSGGSAPGQAVIGGVLVKVMRNGIWIASNGASEAVRRITTADSPYQAKPYQIVVVDASNGPVQVVAPGHGNGIRFSVKKNDPSANPVNVTGNSFDGAGSYQETAQGKSQDFMSDGAVWLLV